jgi:hypothetical protein
MPNERKRRQGAVLGKDGHLEFKRPPPAWVRFECKRWADVFLALPTDEAGDLIQQMCIDLTSDSMDDPAVVALKQDAWNHMDEKLDSTIRWKQKKFGEAFKPTKYELKRMAKWQTELPLAAPERVPVPTLEEFVTYAVSNCGAAGPEKTRVWAERTWYSKQERMRDGEDFWRTGQDNPIDNWREWLIEKMFPSHQRTTKQP